MIVVNGVLSFIPRHSGTRVFAWTRNLEIPGSPGAPE
jgi:phage-related protein